MLKVGLPLPFFVQKLPRVLVLGLQLLNKALNFFALGVELVTHVREDNIEVNGILVLLASSVKARACVPLALLIRQELCSLLLNSALGSRLFQHLEKAITLQLLLDDVLEDLNVVALLLVGYGLLAEGHF